MALEPAGVSLQAQGFNEYIKKLDTIEKKNREVFDTQFKGTDKSFKEVTSAAKKYEQQLKKTSAAEKKAANEAKKLAEAQKTAAATQRQAAISTGNAILNLAKQFATFAFENAKLAATFDAQKQGLANLAASFGQSGGEIEGAIVKASKGTLSNLQAMNAANEALLLGVAKTPEEFDKFTKAALVLGRTVGLSAKESIGRFTTALGRESLLRLDDFGNKAAEVNEEIERLAQSELGKLPQQLTKAEKSAIFIQAALNVSGENVDKIGQSAGDAIVAFEKLSASSENLKVTLGEVFRPAGASIANSLSEAALTAQKAFAFIAAGATGSFSIISQNINNTKNTFLNLAKTIKGEPTEAILSWGEILDNAAILAQDRFKDVASTITGVSFDEPAMGAEDFKDDIDDATVSLKAYENALKQAENLQLSFARSAEDAARKLARANEDVARKQGRQVSKLEEKQAKDREKILDDQIKERENFEKDSRKEIASAEKEIAKERAKADESRLKAQKKLQDKLRQQEERFRLSQLQGSRRFALAERRLRAEGDILALQELREDRELTLQEEKENFGQQQKETTKSGKEQIKEQEKVSNDRVNEVKERIEAERAELLAGFDTELSDFQQKQIEERANLQAKFAEQAEDRKIALARQEEDRRISQARQLEDLGRSLAEQEGVTKEGSERIALALEEVFGVEGTASNIMTGFTDKTESKFKNLFENINEIVTDEGKKIGLAPVQPGRRASNASGIPAFQDGGVVPGPLGSPQLAVVHGGETVLPTGQEQSFAMTAPVIPAQVVDVNMSGGFNITGDGQGNEEVIQAATVEMVENFRIAIDRLARRN